MYSSWNIGTPYAILYAESIIHNAVQEFKRKLRLKSLLENYKYWSFYWEVEPLEIACYFNLSFVNSLWVYYSAIR